VDDEQADGTAALIMPKRQFLLDDLKGEHDYGILLMAQIGGVPNEMQFVIQTASYDPDKEGLRPRRSFVIRALGVFEQRVSLGVFGRLAFAADHPILYHHNAPRAQIFIQSKPQNVNEVIIDISQTYISTFGAWRNVAEMGSDLNRAMPMATLLETGYGLLGTMPKPLAERIAKVLDHHKITYSLTEEANYQPTDEHGRSKLSQALLIDFGYVVALEFTVEELGKV
jgi:hypothetical protein